MPKFGPPVKPKYFRLHFEHQEKPTSDVTGECPHTAQDDAAKLEVFREANCLTYQNSLNERYHT